MPSPSARPLYRHTHHVEPVQLQLISPVGGPRRDQGPLLEALLRGLEKAMKVHHAPLRLWGVALAAGHVFEGGCFLCVWVVSGR